MSFDGKPIRDSELYLASAQALPQNTSADGDEGSFLLGNTNGALAVQIYVETVLAVADTKVLTVKLHDSADNSTFAEFATLYTITAAAGSGAIAAGTQLGEDFVIPPGCNEYVKVIITTTDAACTGALDIPIRYLDR